MKAMKKVLVLLLVAAMVLALRWLVAKTLKSLTVILKDTGH